MKLPLRIFLAFSIFLLIFNFFPANRLIEAEDVGKTMEKVNKTYLPLFIKIIPAKDITPVQKAASPLSETAASSETKPEYNAASQYTVASSVKTPQPVPNNIGNFFTWLFETIGNLFNPIDYGNKKAKEFAGTALPEAAVEKTLAYVNPNADTSLVQTDKQVLGVNNQDSEAMARALPVLQCGNLPFGVGNCSNGNMPGASPTPKITNGHVKPPNSEPTGGKTGTIGNNCPFGTGWCSVEYLKEDGFFGDEKKAEKASAICQKESGSNPFSINYGCLREDPDSRTQEYSIGLFQINLWWDRCNAGDTLASKQVGPPISCEEGPQFEECTQEFEDPDRNIEFAVALSANGTVWTAWSVSRPEYCNIQ